MGKIKGCVVAFLIFSTAIMVYAQAPVATADDMTKCPTFGGSNVKSKAALFQYMRTNKPKKSEYFVNNKNQGMSALPGQQTKQGTMPEHNPQTDYKRSALPDYSTLENRKLQQAQQEQQVAVNKPSRAEERQKKRKEKEAARAKAKEEAVARAQQEKAEREAEEKAIEDAIAKSSKEDKKTVEKQNKKEIIQPVQAEPAVNEGEKAETVNSTANTDKNADDTKVSGKRHKKRFQLFKPHVGKKVKHKRTKRRHSSAVACPGS